jgi:tetratricopeptide (TPR) repeat protein
MAKKTTTERARDIEDLTSTESFIDKYKKPLMIGGGAIVAIILGIIGYKAFISGPKEEKSLEAYWPAFYEFEKDSLELAANGNENFQGMYAVADEYAGTSGGNIANYTLGIAAMDRGEYEQAITYFDECDFDDVVVGTLVIGLKGDCYVEMDKFEEAADLFLEAAEREENDFTSPMMLKKAGLAYEALKDKQSALAAYEKIKTEWETSEEAVDIDKFIARVQG